MRRNQISNNFSSVSNKQKSDSSAFVCVALWGRKFMKESKSEWQTSTECLDAKNENLWSPLERSGAKTSATTSNESSIELSFLCAPSSLKETIGSGSLTLADFSRCASLLATVQKFITFRRGKLLDRQPIQVTYENYADQKKREEGHKNGNIINHLT